VRDSTLLFIRLGILCAVGFLAAMALSGGNSFSGYWGCLWLAGLCAQMSRGR
jgi:hypothetical protein